MDPPMFFGFVGFFSTLLLWPGLFLLHTTGQEPFQMPTLRQWEYLVVNGVVGTVLSELLWLLGCFYTSSLIATLSIGLTIPLSIIADIAWKQKSYHAIFVVGAIPMFCSFFIIALLTQYQDWDPLMDFCKYLAKQCRRLFCCIPNASQYGYQRPTEMRNSEYMFNRQEREFLIGQNSCDRENNDDFNEMLVSSENIEEQNMERNVLLSHQDTNQSLINGRTSDISESEAM